VEDMEGDILFCTRSSTTTTEENNFIMVVSPYNEVGLNWYQCVKIYTDYSQALLGAH
jgi:hypothetical protein